MTVVLDTNVWISALVRPESPPARIVDAFLLGLFSVSTTDRLWNELIRALSYERVRRLFAPFPELGTPEKRVSQLRAMVSVVPEIEPRSRWVQTDPDDDWVIQCALTAQANRIVTGDRALLSVGTVEGTKILTVRDFLTELGLVAP